MEKITSVSIEISTELGMDTWGDIVVGQIFYFWFAILMSPEEGTTVAQQDETTVALASTVAIASTVALATNELLDWSDCVTSCETTRRTIMCPNKDTVSCGSEAIAVSSRLVNTNCIIHVSKKT